MNQSAIHEAARYEKNQTREQSSRKPDLIIIITGLINNVDERCDNWSVFDEGFVRGGAVRGVSRGYACSQAKVGGAGAGAQAFEASPAAAAARPPEL